MTGPDLSRLNEVAEHDEIVFAHLGHVLGELLIGE